jgi:hypothetical protein
MPPRKKNSKSSRRRTGAARKAQPPARRAGGQPATASPPSGRVPPEAPGSRADNPAPGVTSGTAVPPGPAGNVPAGLDHSPPATELPPGLRSARNSQPGPAAANALLAANPLPGVVPDGQRVSARSRDTMTVAQPPAAAKRRSAGRPARVGRQGRRGTAHRDLLARSR